MLLTAAAAAPDTGLRWKPCPGDQTADQTGMECADLKAPVDWAKPDGRTITLKLGRLPATGRSEGSVLVAYGGPGGPGIAFTRQRPELWKELRARMDIVTWDTRGYGEQFGGLSTGLPCHARDMEAIREALGEPKLNFYGASYAGAYGQAYARLYPERVRTMVLDGTFNHSTADHEKELVAMARDNDRHLERFFAWCESDRSCELHDRDVSGVWRRLVARADRQPILAETVNVHYDGRALRYLGLGLARRGATAWPALAEAVRDAMRGDASGFAPPPERPPYPDAATGITECLDWPRPTRLEELAETVRRLRRVAPHTGTASTMVMATLQCVGWPTAVTNPPKPLPDGLPPLLGAGARGEYDATMRAVGQMPGSRGIYHDGPGHTLYPVNRCAREHVNRYFTDRTLPPPGTRC